MQNEEWKSGRIKKWFADKGFGFVLLDGTSQDAFLHVTKVPHSIRDAVRIGDEVEVLTAIDKKGLRVVKIRYPL